MIESKKGIYYNKNWDEKIGTYMGDIIPNEEAAIDVATVIYANLSKNNTQLGYIPQVVFYDEQDEIWIVSFWPTGQQDVIGGDCNIALQKKDGKVLRIWYGE